MFEEEVVSIGVKNQCKKTIKNRQKIAAKRIRKTDKKNKTNAHTNRQKYGQKSSKKASLFFN